MGIRTKFKFDPNSPDPCGIIGKIFGKLTVLSYDGHYRDRTPKQHYQYWYKVQCSCRLKTVFVTTYRELVSGNTTSCGKCKFSEPILPGDKFGELTVLKLLPPRPGSGHTRALCECSCEGHPKVVVEQTRLRTGNTTTCGGGWHYIKEEYKGRLKLGPIPGTDVEVLEICKTERSPDGSRLAICKCHHVNPLTHVECNKIFKAKTDNLISGNTTSCGCSHSIYPDEVTRTLARKWFGMTARCNNANHQSYADYGGRGIKICPEWDKTREGRCKFINDALDLGYKLGLSIDRKGNDESYVPNNVRFVGMQVQNNNKRNNHYITVDGVKQSAADWARELGVDVTMFTNKLRATKDDAEFVRRLRDGREKITGRLSYDLCNKKRTRIDKGVFRIKDTLTIDGVTKTYPEWEQYYHTYQHFIKRRLKMGYTEEEIAKSLKQFCTEQRFKKREQLFTVENMTFGITGWAIRLNVPRTLLQSKLRHGGIEGLTNFIQSLNLGILTIDGVNKTFHDWEQEFHTRPGFCYQMYKKHNGNLIAVVDELKFWKQTLTMPF